LPIVEFGRRFQELGISGRKVLLNLTSFQKEVKKALFWKEVGWPGVS